MLDLFGSFDGALSAQDLAEVFALVDKGELAVEFTANGKFSVSKKTGGKGVMRRWLRLEPEAEKKFKKRLADLGTKP